MVIISFLLPNTLVKDEHTFYNTAVSFRNLDFANFFTLIKTYNSPQTPIVFLVSGFLLKINNSIFLLRCFDSITIFAALFIFCKTIELLNFKKFEYKLLIAGTLLLNPYFHFIGILFYTDALYIFVISIILYSIILKRKNIIYYAALFFLPLIRQFGIIFAPSDIADNIKLEYPFFNKHAVYSALTLSGPLIVFWLWCGFMPDNSFRASMNIIRHKYGYVFPYIPAYNLSAIGFYLSPLFLALINKVKKEKIFYAGGLIASVFYLCFPVQQNFTNLFFQPNVTTLGFYHKTVVAVFGIHFFNVVLIIFSFLAGGWILILLTSKKIPDLFKILIMFYFLMSLFNLQAWDKYLIDIEMIILISIGTFIKNNESKIYYSHHVSSNGYPQHP